jgi:D-alanine-D-alanine ligase
MKKITVAVIYGGTNTEHEVSIVSARSIIAHVNRNKYHLIPIYISKQNRWYQTAPNTITKSHKTLGNPISPSELLTQNINIVFPMIHGPYGEDGTIQGLLEMLHLPYVGCNVIASALCMDKAIQKELCLFHGLPIVPFVSVTHYQWHNNQAVQLQNIKHKLSYPLFIKPANQGSSIGIVKVNREEELTPAINHAFQYDTKVIVETGIDNAREIECAVLGNHQPQASALGEIVSSNEFYDYDAKYIDNKSTSHIPANIPKETKKLIQSIALQAFSILNCSGLARVDFLVNNKTNQVYLNELNTMPGFTPISMYPKLWQASGIEYEELLDRLIKLGLDHHRSKTNRTLSYNPKVSWHQQKPQPAP